MLTTDLLVTAYSQGIFPMAHDDGELYWHDPDPRAIFPLDRITPNRRALRSMRNSGYRCTVDHGFEEVMRACADRETTWINEEMVSAYLGLHRQGLALSVETWMDGQLIGGLYGVLIGGAFFGESMFSRATNASKTAFYFLIDHLRARGVTLFDTQYINDHTRTLGAIEITRDEFAERLLHALQPRKAI